MSGPRTGSNGMLYGHARPRGSVQPGMPAYEPTDHELMKEALRPSLKQFCENIRTGIANDERTAMNLYYKIMCDIGAGIEVNVNVACEQAFGLPYSEVNALVMAARDSSAMGVAEAASAGIELCQWVLKQDPERREWMRAALFGGDDATLALRADSGPDANGHSS